MDSLEKLIRDLRTFDRRREVTNQLAREVRKPVPEIRKKIRARALATLPASGGFGEWVSKLSVTASVKLQGRAAGVRLKGRRKGFPDRNPKVDLRAIDRGRTRHPSWGRRAEADWHVQRVSAGFFTLPGKDRRRWRKAILAAVDQARAVIRRGY